jgi:hypothetical protein
LALGGVAILLLIRKPRVGIVVVAVFLAMAIVAVLSWKPIYKTRIPRLAEDVKKAANPSELQHWAMSIMQEGTQSNWFEISKIRIPVGIGTLASDGSPLQQAFCEGVSNEHRTVLLVWGGGFGHWGILIGSPSFRIGSPSYRVDHGDDNYYVEWKPGLYFWHQTH